MTEHTDLVPRLESWLVEDDGLRLPERVIDAAIAQAAELSQARRRGAMPTAGQMRVLLAAAVLVGAAVLGIALVRLVSPPVGTESPSPSASASPSPSHAPVTPPATVTYVSDGLGFSATQPDQQGPWANFLYAPIAVGQDVLTFPAGDFIGADVWSAFVIVSVGTEAEGAVVGVSFPEAPTPAPSASPTNPDWEHATLVRVWASTADELAAAFVAAAGGRVTGPTTLGGDPAVAIADSNEMAQTVVCVHAGRAYVVSTTSFLRRAPALEWSAFLASFRFID